MQQFDHVSVGYQSMFYRLCMCSPMNILKSGFCPGVFLSNVLEKGLGGRLLQQLLLVSASDGTVGE